VPGVLGCDPLVPLAATLTDGANDAKHAVLEVLAGGPDVVCCIRNNDSLSCLEAISVSLHTRTQHSVVWLPTFSTLLGFFQPCLCLCAVLRMFSCTRTLLLRDVCHCFPIHRHVNRL
jgi:hypothetical protein